MKKVLGKGLSALIPDNFIAEESATPVSVADHPEQIAQPNKVEPATQQGFTMLPIDKVHPNPDQPRHQFTPDGIAELAASIKEKGVLQPIVVKKDDDNHYTLICGERRLRAATLCGLSEIPVVIKDVAQDDFLEWALIENIQREDLSPVEEAEAYQRLMETRMLSHDDVAKRVGKDRSTVANSVRLLRLPKEVLEMMEHGRLMAGHARALLGLLTPEHQRQLARRIAEENLSVRQVEAIVTRSVAHKRKPRSARNLTPEIVDLESRLSQHFGTRVRIFPKKTMKQGRIEMDYYSLDDLDRMISKMGLPEKQ